ncbi:enoyl-CoA hydratase [Seohaeicola saemankumensis]|nr:enoyl-CoA hydratase [Seohaeicola saemankumensis]MCA0873369.1 enoyl-CoA hydratase [Seohaeicola saemankumensis]
MVQCGNQTSNAADDRLTQQGEPRMSDTPVLLSCEGSVATITLNRPEVLNALSKSMISELLRTFRDLSADPDLRAIVLTGSGRAFSCGVDLKELAEATDIKSHFQWHGEESLVSVVRACPHPVISAVNGFAITGGLELALMGDFLIASENAVFADTHARVGITPSWGMTQVLPRLVGLNRARQMSLTGDFVDAKTACKWGLVNEVVAADMLMIRAAELAAQIAETDKTTLSRIRSLITDGSGETLEQGMAREAAVFDEHMGGVSSEKVAQGRENVTKRGRRVAGNARPGTI